MCLVLPSLCLHVCFRVCLWPRTHLVLTCLFVITPFSFMLTHRHTQTVSSNTSVNSHWLKTQMTCSFACRAGKWDPITSGHRRHVDEIAQDGWWHQRCTGPQGLCDWHMEPWSSNGMRPSINWGCIWFGSYLWFQLSTCDLITQDGCQHQGWTGLGWFSITMFQRMKNRSVSEIHNSGSLIYFSCIHKGKLFNHSAWAKDACLYLYMPVPLHALRSLDVSRKIKVTMFCLFNHFVMWNKLLQCRSFTF